MRQVTGEILVNASKESVWKAIADLGAVQEYAPGVQKSYYLSKDREGVGAARHCDIRNGLLKGFLRERVTDWEDGQSYVIELYESRGVPYKKMTAEFKVAPQGTQALYTQTIRFSMKGGPIAPLLELVGKMMMKKAVHDMLLGLKRFVETGSRARPDSSGLTESVV